MTPTLAGTRNFAYDDQNELISVWQTNVWREDYVYDGKLRRRITRQFTWNGSGWQLTNEVHYVYDGNVVIQERDQNNLPVVTYTRGVDLSGTLQGAGGIGGLLARTDMGRLTVNDPLASAYYHADGNGNITALVAGLMDTNQVLVAKYLYDPYGNLLAESGPLAGGNKYRFSSKEWDSQAGLYYYLYRFYDPNLQRWLNRDPYGVSGGINLYEFVGNNPVIWIDRFGLAITGTPVPGGAPPGADGGIECKCGKLVVVNNNHGPDSKCTQAHEEQHIKDWEARYGANLCAGVKDGYLPVGGDGFSQFLNQSECNAYKAGKKCREDLLKNCPSQADKDAIKSDINRDDQMINKYCNGK